MKWPGRSRSAAVMYQRAVRCAPIAVIQCAIRASIFSGCSVWYSISCTKAPGMVGAGLDVTDFSLLRVEGRLSRREWCGDGKGRVVAPLSPGAIVDADVVISGEVQGDRGVCRSDAALTVGDDLACGVKPGLAEAIAEAAGVQVAPGVAD